MTTLRLKITNVDMNGYCGREHHPHPSDIGLIVTPVKLESFVTLAADGDDAGGTDDFQPTNPNHLCVLATPTDDDGVWQVWTVVTKDGRVLEVMDFEVQPATAEDLAAIGEALVTGGQQ